MHSVQVSIQTFDFLGVHLHIFSCCAFCMDGIYPNVVYYSQSTNLLCTVGWPLPNLMSMNSLGRN